MAIRTQLTSKLAMSLIASALFIPSANAQQNHQFFDGAGTDKPKQASVQFPKEKPVQGALAICSPKTPIVTWFEKMDDMEYTLGATQADKALLDRPLEEKADRVQQWTETASKVARNYRLLATTISSTDVPSTAPLLTQYRGLKADWYKDTAGIYEDLIRPRKAARTRDELETQINGIQHRVAGLAAERKQLLTMDTDLRKQYNVHLNFYTNALQQYVKGKTPTR